MKFSNDYATKQKEGVSAEKVMMSLAWNVKDLSDLNESGRRVVQECGNIKQRLEDLSYDRISGNFAKSITLCCESAKTFVKRVYRYKRVAATHILIVMISPEQRVNKPYALPVQCIAYKSLKDKEVRNIANKLIKEMSARGMKVAGTLQCKFYPS